MEPEDVWHVKVSSPLLPATSAFLSIVYQIAIWSMLLTTPSAKLVFLVFLQVLMGSAINYHHFATK